MVVVALLLQLQLGASRRRAVDLATCVGLRGRLGEPARVGIVPSPPSSSAATAASLPSLSRSVRLRFLRTGTANQRHTRTAGMAPLDQDGNEVTISSVPLGAVTAEPSQFSTRRELPPLGDCHSETSLLSDTSVHRHICARIPRVRSSSIGRAGGTRW